MICTNLDCIYNNEGSCQGVPCYSSSNLTGTTSSHSNKLLNKPLGMSGDSISAEEYTRQIDKLLSDSKKLISDTAKYWGIYMDKDFSIDDVEKMIDLYKILQGRTEKYESDKA